MNLWGGFKNQFDQNVQTIYNLDVQEAYYIFDSILVRAPVEGDRYLRLQSESGSAGLYRYFSYTPGDTLEYSFSYMIPSGQQNSNDPGFSLGIRLTDTDADANFLDFEEYFWNIMMKTRIIDYLQMTNGIRLLFHFLIAP